MSLEGARLATRTSYHLEIIFFFLDIHYFFFVGSFESLCPAEAQQSGFFFCDKTRLDMIIDSIKLVLFT